MKPGENYNHPKKGDLITVEPIRDLQDIKEIKRLLTARPRNLCLFTLGVNTNLRASDLLGITYRQVTNLRSGQNLILKEKKTGKIRRITLNKTVIKSIKELIHSTDYEKDDYLFKSQRGGALSVPFVSRLVKQWCKNINLKGHYASHTLRKTWGYHQRVTYHVGIPELMVCFNHSTQRQTLDYLCIQPDEIESVYMNEL